MRSVNRHTLLGHVGNLVQLKNVLKVNIATNRDWLADGEGKQRRIGCRSLSSTKSRPSGSRATLDRVIWSMSNPGSPIQALSAMESKFTPPTSLPSSLTSFRRGTHSCSLAFKQTDADGRIPGRRLLWSPTASYRQQRPVILFLMSVMRRPSPPCQDAGQ